MSFLAVIHAQTPSTRPASRYGIHTPFIAKTLLLAVIAIASAGGMLVTDGATTARVIASAGGDWANLLRAMAVLKLFFAGAATAALLWRLGAPISATRWGFYALAASAAWAGPGLIWGLAHIVLGALLLHGGLIAMAVLFWRDRAAAALMSDMIAAAAESPTSRE